MAEGKGETVEQRECPRCGGNGRVEMLEHCPVCKGSGTMTERGEVYTVRRCPECGALWPEQETWRQGITALCALELHRSNPPTLSEPITLVPLTAVREQREQLRWHEERVAFLERVLASHVIEPFVQRLAATPALAEQRTEGE